MPNWTWFNSRIFAGGQRGVAGVELATVSEPPARKPGDLGASPCGRRPQPPLICDLRVNRAAWRREPQVGQTPPRFFRNPCPQPRRGDISPTKRRGRQVPICGSVPQVLFVMSPLRGWGEECVGTSFQDLGADAARLENVAASRLGRKASPRKYGAW